MPVTSWSTTAGNNNAAPPNGAPEGMAPSDVNNVIRQNMADVAVEAQTNQVKKLNSISGTNTITADMDPELAAYQAGMIVVLTPANTNTGAVTLSIDGLTALDILKEDGDSLIAGDLVAGVPAVLVLDSGGDDFYLLNLAVTKPVFSSHRVTGAQTLPQNTVTDLVFNSVIYDVGSAMNATTGIYTAVRAGYYVFNAGLFMQNNDSVSATLNSIYFSKNNATSNDGSRFDFNITTNTGTAIGAGSNSFLCNCTAIISLAVGDTVRVKADVGAVDGSSAFGMQLTSWFQGHCIT